MKLISDCIQLIGSCKFLEYIFCMRPCVYINYVQEQKTIFFVNKGWCDCRSEWWWRVFVSRSWVHGQVVGMDRSPAVGCDVSKLFGDEGNRYAGMASVLMEMAVWWGCWFQTEGRLFGSIRWMSCGIAIICWITWLWKLSVAMRRKASHYYLDWLEV